MEWQPVSHDLQSPTIQCIGNSHVEVTDEDVRCHPSARSVRLHISSANPRLPKIPALEQAARWWPRASSGRPHRQLRREKGKGRRRRRRRRTLNSCGSIRVCMLNGVVWRATPAPGPLSERINASSLSERSGKCCVTRKFCSMRDEASCFHPLRCAPGSKSSGPLGSGRSPRANADQEGTTKPGTPASRSAASAAAFRQIVCGCSSNRATMVSATAG